MNEPTPGEIQKFFALVWDGEMKDWTLLEYSIEEVKRMYAP